MARRDDIDDHQEARQLPEGFLRPRRRGVEAPREQMRRCQSGLHTVELGVEWTEPHGVREALDGGVRLAVPCSQKSGEKPGRREIGIEHERPVEQGDAGSARQAGALGDLAWAIGHPAVDLAPEIAPCRHRIAGRKIRVTDRASQCNRLNRSRGRS
jgi:hypothetical protein